MKQQARTDLTVRKLTKNTKAVASPPSPFKGGIGIVKAVAAGGSLDGVAQITVTTSDGADTFAPYLDSYTAPAVGDQVWVELANGSPIIIGRVVGQPNF